jgi:hypothetical protein
MRRRAEGHRLARGTLRGRGVGVGEAGFVDKQARVSGEGCGAVTSAMEAIAGWECADSGPQQARTSS